jgi:hypothetical protein
LAATLAEKQKMRGTRIAYIAQSAATAFNPAHKLIRQYTQGPLRHNIKPRLEAKKEEQTLYKKLLLPDPDNIGYRYPHQVSAGTVTLGLAEQIAGLTLAQIVNTKEPLLLWEAQQRLWILKPRFLLWVLLMHNQTLQHVKELRKTSLHELFNRQSRATWEKAQGLTADEADIKQLEVIEKKLFENREKQDE